MKCICEQWADETVERRQHPALIGKIAELEAALVGPLVPRAPHDDDRVIVEGLDLQALVVHLAEILRNCDIKLTLADVAADGARTCHLHLKDNAWIFLCDPIDDCSHDPGRDRLGTPDAYLSGGWIRQKIDIGHALAELLQDGGPASQKSKPIRRQLDAITPPVPP